MRNETYFECKKAVDLTYFRVFREVQNTFKYRNKPSIMSYGFFKLIDA